MSYKIFPVSCSESGQTFTRYLYYKAVNQGELEGKAIFVPSIPLHYDYQDISEIFSCFGAIDSVELQKKNRAVQAFVIFEDESSLKRAMEFQYKVSKKKKKANRGRKKFRTWCLW